MIGRVVGVKELNDVEFKRLGIYCLGNYSELLADEQLQSSIQLFRTSLNIYHALFLYSNDSRSTIYSRRRSWYRINRTRGIDVCVYVMSKHTAKSTTQRPINSIYQEYQPLFLPHLPAPNFTNVSHGVTRVMA